MDITLYKLRQRERKIPISKLVGELGKIGQTAWQNQLDVTKIGSATVRANEGLGSILGQKLWIYDQIIDSEELKFIGP
jgi:hypothetical protein